MRVTLKWKIFIGSIVLALSIVIVDMMYTNHAVERAAMRADELQGAYDRYLRFQESKSNGYAAAIDAWAVSSQALRQALNKGDDDAARPLIAGVLSAISEDLRPDFLVVVDRHGDPTISPGAP